MRTTLAEALDLNPLKTALGGGEDYVLLFSLSANIEPPTRFDATEVGTLSAEGGVLLNRDGQIAELPKAGWDHLDQTEV